MYDAAGNLTSDGSISHSYDARGRHTRVTIDAIAVNYEFNGFGERVDKNSVSTTIVPGNIQHYVYDQTGHTIGEYDNNGGVIEETVFLGDTPVVVLKSTVSESGTTVQPYYVYADQTDTPRVISRASDNQIVWRWDTTDPFGLHHPDENPSGSGTFIYNQRFPGQIFDQESNLHYNYFRDYDPQIGRHVQSDPIGLGGGINTYGYVRGNPVSRTDLLGLVDIYVGGAKDGTTKIVSSWVDNNATGSKYFEWTQGAELSEYISKVPANEPINLYGHSYGGNTAAWAAIRAAGRVTLLTTLDPVSRFKPDFKKLRCSVGTWRNVNAVPIQKDGSDRIAWLGEKWGTGPRGSATSFAEANVNHADFAGLMNGIDTSGSNACDCFSK